MPDASGGIASGLYWVITGKMPAEDLEDDEDDEREDDKDPETKKDKKGR